ncbi:hypothetical protein BKA57DRAFT_477993 [Linnemannia elongata]|nr:hypothetical protein BKA57DRAFT_477993 [Linnemannia elongata]
MSFSHFVITGLLLLECMPVNTHLSLSLALLLAHFLFLSATQDFEPTLRMPHRTLHAPLVRSTLAPAKGHKHIFRMP